MISISGKEWKEYKTPKRLIDKYSSDFDISENLSKFYLSRNFNKEDILVKEVTDYNLNIFSKNKDFLLASETIIDIINNKIIVNSLITHKSQNTKKIVTGEIDIKK